MTMRGRHEFDWSNWTLTMYYEKIMISTTIGTWVLEPHLCLPRIIVKKCENILNVPTWMIRDDPSQ